MTNLFDKEVKISDFEYQTFIPEQNQPDLTLGNVETIYGGELNDPRVFTLQFNYRWD